MRRGTRFLAAIVVWSIGSSSAMADRALSRFWVQEGTEFRDNGDSKSALERFESAIGSDPDYLQAYREALPLWIQSGQLARAQTHLERLTLRCDDCVFAWYGLGAIYRKQGRFDLAELAYEVYLAKRPRDADAHYGLALSLVASDKPGAKAALERYLRLESRPERQLYRDRAKAILARYSSGKGVRSFESEYIADARLAREEKRWVSYLALWALDYLFSP